MENKENNYNNYDNIDIDLLQIDLRQTSEKKHKPILSFIKYISSKILGLCKYISRYLWENKILTVPVIVLIFAGITSAVVLKISTVSNAAADFFTSTVSFVMRFAFAGLTNNIPFSLAEFALCASVPLIIYLIFNFIFKIAYVKPKHKLPAFLKSIFRFIAFLCAFLFIFTFTFGVCYGRTPINEIINKTADINFERRLISSEDLIKSMQILVEEANKTAENIKYIYSDTGSTKMPYNLNELNKKLNESYKNLLSRHNFLNRINVNVKPVIMSVEMSKMHIAGIYIPFTGEANINIDSPDYNLPFAAAHEMAHSMGIAREDEANFTAFLVCLYSGDNYIKYSGLVNIIEYISGALHRADNEKYNEIMSGISYVIKNELNAYSIFFDKYRNTQISKVATAVNDTYLKSQGQEQGEKSYGLVVDLAVAYLVDVYGKIK